MSQPASILKQFPTHGQTEPTSATAIDNWLSSFGSRQTRLLVARGLATAIIVIVVGALLIAGLDAIGILSDSFRWTLSFVLYATALSFGGWFGWFQAARRQRPTEVAKCVEFACPELRESLLSCVELSEQPVEARNFSGDFLKALQRQVAYQLDDFSLSNLLPWSIIRMSTLAAATGLAVLAIACFIPSLEMPLRLSRALLPFVELERPSRTHIDIVSPKRSGLVVPENQPLEFEIKVEGVPADEAWLEVRPAAPSARDGNVRYALTRIQSSPLVFAGTAPIGSKPVEYRFLAGDAETKFRRILPTPRPRVSEFHHRIQFPEHAQLDASDVRSERGAITALEGSIVDIGIVPSMPLQSAIAVVESLDTGERQTIPLLLTEDQTKWHFSWPVRSDARYQLKLIAKIPDAETPIENTFSPFHEINSVADHPPSVTWIATDATLWDQVPRANQTWIVAPEEIVSMAAAIADDLPSASLEQQISINRGPWVSLPHQIPLKPLDPSTISMQRDWNTWQKLDGVELPTSAQGEWSWDILSASAAAGDTIAVRMAAKDLLGQVSHSTTVEFSLASSGFDRDRHDALFLRASLVPELQHLANMLHKAVEELRPKMQRVKDGSWAIADRKELEKELSAFAREWIEQSVRIRERSNTMIAQLPRVLDQSESELVVRIVSKLEKEFASRLLVASRALLWERDSQIVPAADATEPIPEKILELLRQQLERGIGALSEADAQSARLVDIYRQMVGHDFLTALTKDMIYLKDYQSEQLARAPKLDFAMLARSQRVAGQYLDNIAQLGQRMEPFVSQHLRDQLSNFYRFLDQSRSDLQELSQQEPSPQAMQDLTQRMVRFANEMRDRHWAFNLDGGVWWNIADMRRDLIQRSAGIGNAMLQSIETAYRSHEFLNDASLDSDMSQQLRSIVLNELTLGLLPATNQIVDRREIHQHRIPTDPMFPGDMGLAIRAWQSAMESWSELLPKSEKWVHAREDLQGIAKAYSVLEAAHEMQDIRATLEALRRQEQYDWQSLEGRLNHLRQWESMDLRIEMAQQWMRGAGFPHPVADQFNALRWKDSSNRVRQRFEPRRSGSSDAVVSAASEIEAVLQDWNEVDVASAPTIEAARKFLARFAPSVSQLAQRAAEHTRTLQDLSQAANHSQSTPKELSSQQERVERTVRQLQDALLETALRQDILDQQQLMLAKDSDRALQWVDEVMQPMQQATRELSQTRLNASDPKTVSQAAEQAVEKQSAAAQAFDAIAEHFASANPLTNPEDALSDSPTHPNALAPPNADTSKPPLENYDKADRLAAIANSNPEQLLQQLEAELERSPPMQRELSQLSKETVADAVSQLRNAATQEGTLARQLENADLVHFQSKEIQSQQLKQLADSVDRFAVSVLEKASQATRRMNLPETSDSINKIGQSMQQAAREARRADPSDTQTNLDAMARELLDRVQAAQRTVSDVTPRIQERIEQPSSPDPQQRQGQLTEMQSWQSLMRDDLVRRAKDRARENQQLADNRKREAEDRQREAQQKLEQRRNAVEAFQKAPENETYKSQLDQLTREWFDASERAQQAKRLSETTDSIAKQSADRSQEIENSARANLDKPSPIASLAVEQLGIAMAQLDHAQSGLQAMQPTTQERRPPAPKADSASQAQSKQQEIAAAVDQVVDQLERSARHEARLHNALGNEQLAKQTEQVRGVADKEVSTAQQQLEKASATAKQAERQELDQSRSNPAPSQSPRPTAESAIQSANQAAKQLAESAKSIEQLAAPKSQESSGNTAASQDESQTGDSAESGQSAKQMARMLDSLDQQLRSNQSRQSKPEGTDAPSSQQSQSTRPTESDQRKPSNRDAHERSGLESALRESADQVAAQLQAERLSNRDGNKASAKNTQSNSRKFGGQPNDQGRTENPATGDSRLPAVLLDVGNDWGRLREKRAEDLTQGRREGFDPEFNDAIRAYYRALGIQPK